MALTTLEEAKKCPRCSLPGEDRKVIPAPAAAHLPRGTTIHLIYCMTELCPWFQTCWQVQVNADGSIPAPKDHTHEPKVYAGIEGHDDLAEKIREALMLQREMEVKPGGEINNPNSTR